MEDYHLRRGHAFPTMGRVSSGKAGTMDGVPMVFFEVEPFSGSRFPVAVIWDGVRYGVDWESLTAYGTVEWSEFVERRPTESQTLRVFVHSPGKDDSSLSLATGQTTFHIEHRDDADSVIAIAGAETASTLKLLTEKRRTPATLEVRWKTGSGAAVVEIVRVIAPRWSL